MTDTPHTDKASAAVLAGQTPKAERQYDMRRLSYAGTFKNPLKAGTIRVIEWLTAKVQLLRHSIPSNRKPKALIPGAQRASICRESHRREARLDPGRLRCRVSGPQVPRPTQALE